MKVYLAAPYSEMKLMQEWRGLLEFAGHTCTSKWLDGNEDSMPRAAAAQMDLDDVDAADVVLSKILPKGAMFSSGGRHVEFGYGVARGKLMVVIGPDCENIFHELRQVVRCRTIAEALHFLAPRFRTS